MHRLALIVALTGCAGGDEPDTGRGDTAGDTDVVDTGPAPCGRFEVAGTVTVPNGALVPEAPLSIDLIGVTLTDDGLEEREVRAAAELGWLGAGDTAAYSLCMDETPDDADLYTIDEVSPTFRAATYVLRVFEKSGSGGVRSWAGASVPHLLVYAAGTPPQSWSAVGLDAGWNVLTLDLVDETQTTGMPLASGGGVDVRTSLYPVPRSSLSVVVVPDLSQADALAIGAYNITSAVEPTVPAPAVPTVGGHPVTVSAGNANVELGPLPPEPPADHLHALADLPYVRAGVFSVIAWRDADGDRAFDSEEVGLASSVGASPSRSLTYVVATDWRATLYLAQGVEMGWALQSDAGALPWTNGMVLEAGR